MNGEGTYEVVGARCMCHTLVSLVSLDLGEHSSKDSG